MEATSGPLASPNEAVTVGSEAWRESVSTDQRKAVIHYLLKHFQSKPAYTANDYDRLYRLVHRIEEKLWQSSTSREEYLDARTMNMRIKKLLEQYSQSQKAANAQAQAQAAQTQAEVQPVQNGAINASVVAPPPTLPPIITQPPQNFALPAPPQMDQSAFISSAYQPSLPSGNPIIVKTDNDPTAQYAAQYQYQQQLGGYVPMPHHPQQLHLGTLPPHTLNPATAAMQQLQQPVQQIQQSNIMIDNRGQVITAGGVAVGPAAVNTASDSNGGTFQSTYMSNGAPVLVRGGGNNGILQPPTLIPQNGPIQNILENPGGMIPITNGTMGAGHIQAHVPSSNATTDTSQPHASLPPGMMPIGDGLDISMGIQNTLHNSVGGTNNTSPVMVPMNNTQSGCMDDLFTGGVVGGGPGDGTTDNGQLLSNAQRQESRKQQILKQQRWLLFLRHCARCTLKDNECTYGGNCGVAKQLWKHLVICKDPSCTYPRCSPSRELLKHHQRCKSPQCPVCGPVKQYVAKQRETLLRRKLDASGMTQEEQNRYVAQLNARRAAANMNNHPTHSGAATSSGGWGSSAPIVDTQAIKRPRILLQENMGTSLIEYFNALEIRTHINNILLDKAVEPTGTQRQASISLDLDGFGTNLQEEDSCCKVCHRNKLVFEPPLIYCYGCSQRIKRNQIYYATPKYSEIRGMWCHPCVQSPSTGELLKVDTFTVRKAELERKRNDDEQEEAWVQCDSCEGWVHQICGLFNKGRNNEERGFLCPECLLAGLERNQRSVPPERPQAMLTAKDLPRCDLSDFLEARLERAITEERIARAKATGKHIDEVRGAEGICIRVVNNVTKQMEVKPRFYEAFVNQNTGYPNQASYKQKVILLFQHQDGVDMCLYCLYLQEYGQDCAPPNQRVVHLSYLDSVKYFRPEKVTAAGYNVALRTMIYHEVLLGYLQYAKARGYCAMYIWACPPISGDDYIMYCHPGRQKMPRSDRLREWYLTMLRRGKAEGTVTYISNLYDTYFEGGKDHRIERPTVLEMPYLDGDYWPGEAENLLATADDPTVIHNNKARKNSKDSKRWRWANPDASPAEKLLGRLGETIQGIKEDFIVAHLYENCSHCRKYINGDLRYYHPNPPQKITIKSERCFDGIALDRPGSNETSRTVTLTRFQLCSECYVREQGKDPIGRPPVGLPTGVALTDLISEPCPPLPPTEDSVPQIDNEFFDTRNLFLSLCQGNHYQFDSNRRAKHSSMMVLYHLHNPSEPAFQQTCNICNAEMKPGEGYKCTTCHDFDMCSQCHASPAVTHPHELVPQQARKFDETRMRLTEEDRVKREQSLQRTMQLLVHASRCTDNNCGSSNCAKFKALYSHAVKCQKKITGGCVFCRRMWALLQAHSKMCILPNCPVPRCSELRAIRRQQAARQEDARRAAYMQMLVRQQQAQQSEHADQPQLYKME